jgi:phospholipid/cholesterol/gamma-HCH transport system ATP-binding protein
VVSAVVASLVLVPVQGLSLHAGNRLLMRDLNFDIRAGEALAVMGASGCGKSTLLRHLIGLQTPQAGRVLHGGVDLASADDATLSTIRQGFGVTYQAGALFSSMSVGENVMLPLQLFRDLTPAACHEQAQAMLERVSLPDTFDLEPAALSGGMRKRAAIARALVLSPPLLFLDEPSAGLDPPTAARLDDLILELKREHGQAVVLVSHSLDSIFTVADRALFLDVDSQTMTALDHPAKLLADGPATVRDFLKPRRAR